jgi:hypothetical protein
MKQYYLIILMLLAFCICKAQSNEILFTENNFEAKFLNYVPIQKTDVPLKNYNWSKEVISETKKSLTDNGNNYFAAHYWNILTAFDYLQEDKELLKIVFIKLTNSKGGCDYITSFKEKVKFDEKIPDLYNQYYNYCNKREVKEIKFNINKYISDNKLNKSLVKLINKIDSDDQKYRGTEEQTILDKQNQKLIDSLNIKHKKYIGKSLVGEKFESVMWAVIQHSNPEMMEKYLPIVHKAVKKNELDKTTLKMLIDRFYGLKYGYQIFGSQSGFGFKIADEKTRNKIIEKYGIE